MRWEKASLNAVKYPCAGFAVLGDFLVQFCGFSSVSFASSPPPPPPLSFVSIPLWEEGGEDKRQIKKKKKKGGGGEEEKAEAVTRFSF